MTGNLFILGFGFDWSGIDLWWLIDYKKRINNQDAKTVLFDIYQGESDDHIEKNRLLELMNVEVHSYQVINGEYASQYQNVLNDLKRMLKQSI